MKHTEPKYAGCKVVVSTHELALHGIMTLNYIQKKAGLFSGIGTRPGSFSVNKVNVAVARRNVKTKKKIKNVRNADADNVLYILYIYIRYKYMQLHIL